MLASPLGAQADPPTLEERLAPASASAQVPCPASGWTVPAVEELGEALLAAADAGQPGDPELAQHLRSVRLAHEELAGPRCAFCRSLAASATLIHDALGAGSAAELEFDSALEHGGRGGVNEFWLLFQRAEGALNRFRPQLLEELLTRARPLLDVQVSTPQEVSHLVACRAAWFSFWGQLCLDRGALDAAEHAFDAEARALAEAGAQIDPLQEAYLERDRLDLALARKDDVGACEIAARALELLAPAESSVEGQDEARTMAVELRLRGALALHELERSGYRQRGGALRAMTDLMPSMDAFNRLGAQLALAKIHAEGEQPESARTLLDGVLREASTQGRRNEAATALALLARVERVCAERDPERMRATLERLELAFEGMLDSWRETLGEYRGIAFLHYGERYMVLSELAQLSIAVHGKSEGTRRAWNALDRAETLGGLASDLGLHAEPIEARLQRLLRAVDGVCTLVPGRDAGLLLLADREGLTSFEVGSRVRLERLRTQVVGALSRAVRERADFGSRELAEAIRQLQEALLPSDAAQRMLTWRSAIVAFEGMSGHVPLDCFDSGDGQRLGDALTLSYVPSLAVADALYARSTTSQGVPDTRLVVATDPDSRDLARFDLARFEVGPGALDPWVRDWGQRLQLFTGSQADPRVVREAGRAGVEVLQIVAHGIRDLERARSAGVLLVGQDGTSGALWSDGLENVEAPRLAIVLACGSGAMAVERGNDGRESLGGTLLARGSQCVLLSPTELELGGGLALLGEMQADLAQGEAPAEALRRARSSLAGQGRSRVQDYLVYVLGAGHQRLSEAPPAPATSSLNRVWLAAISIGGLVAAAWAFRPRRAARG